MLRDGNSLAVGGEGGGATSTNRCVSDTGVESQASIRTEPRPASPGSPAPSPLVAVHGGEGSARPQVSTSGVASRGGQAGGADMPLEEAVRRQYSLFGGKTVTVHLERLKTVSAYGFALCTDSRGVVVVQEVVPGCQAHEAGMRAGSKIVSIDGFLCKDVLLAAADQRLRDARGTLPVAFKLRRRSSLFKRKSSRRTVRAEDGAREDAPPPAAATPAAPAPTVTAAHPPPAKPRRVPMWYAPNMDARKAKARLEYEPDGSFVVRPSVSKQGEYSLTFKQGDVKHVRISSSKDPPGPFFLNSTHAFPSLAGLVEFYCSHPLSSMNNELFVQLRHPCGTDDFPQPRLVAPANKPLNLSSLAKRAPVSNSDSGSFVSCVSDPEQLPPAPVVVASPYASGADADGRVYGIGIDIVEWALSVSSQAPDTSDSRSSSTPSTYTRPVSVLPARRTAQL